MKRISESARSSDQVREELSAELKKKEAELKRVREDLDKRQSAISSSVLSGLTRGPMLHLLSRFERYVPDLEFSEAFDLCPHCEERFPEGSLQQRESCPECGKSLKGRHITMKYAGGSFALKGKPVKPVGVAHMEETKSEAPNPANGAD